MKQLNEFYKRLIGGYIGNETTRILAEAKRRQKFSATTQRNANKLAALLKPETKPTKNDQRREQLNHALAGK